MRIAAVSYHYIKNFTDPASWLKRISGVIEIMDELAGFHEVVCIHWMNYSGEMRSNDVRHVFVTSKRSINKQLQQLKPDVIIVHGLLTPLQVIMLRLKFRNKARIIVQHHAERPLRGVMKALSRIADYCTDGYFFATRSMADPWINKRLIKDGDKIFAIPEASSIFSVGNNDMYNRNSFLWVGRLNQNKDPITVIKAFADYVKHNPSARLNMIYQANDMLKEVIEAVSLSKASSNIHLEGKVERMEMLRWYRSSGYIICSSFYEGCNISVIEGMSCGCIPIVTKIPSFELHTNNGIVGLQFKAGDHNALLECLLQTSRLDINSERKKVTGYFEQALSFKAIARKMHGAILQLHGNRDGHL